MTAVTGSLSWPTTVLSQTVGQRLCAYSFAAYSDPSLLPPWSCSCCRLLGSQSSVSLITNTSASLQGFFVPRDSVFGIPVVAFRGTTDLQNWIENLQVAKTTPIYGNSAVRVHEGFWNDFWSLRDQIHALVNEYSVSDIFVTGHSLGGASFFDDLTIIISPPLKQPPWLNCAPLTSSSFIRT